MARFVRVQAIYTPAQLAADLGVAKGIVKLVSINEDKNFAIDIQMSEDDAKLIGIDLFNKPPKVVVE